MEEIYDNDELYRNPLEGMGGGVYQSPEQARQRTMSMNCAVLGFGLMFIGGAICALTMALEALIPSGNCFAAIENTGRTIVSFLVILSLPCWAGWAIYLLAAES